MIINRSVEFFEKKHGQEKKIPQKNTGEYLLSFSVQSFKIQNSSNISSLLHGFLATFPSRTVPIPSFPLPPPVPGSVLTNPNPTQCAASPALEVPPPCRSLPPPPTHCRPIPPPPPTRVAATAVPVPPDSRPCCTNPVRKFGPRYEHFAIQQFVKPSPTSRNLGFAAVRTR
jgi:hypothetical protein